MQTFISMLRSINVGGQKSIRMAELKAVYEGMGFERVVTYLQSGNVVFTSPAEEPTSLVKRIETQIEAKFGFPVTVLVRLPQDFQRIVENNPFLTLRSEDPARLYVTFLSASPGEPALQRLNPPPSAGEDEFITGGEEIFVFCPGGYGRTKLSNTFFENKLKVQATTRNWNSVKALNQLAAERKME